MSVRSSLAICRQFSPRQTGSTSVIQLASLNRLQTILLKLRESSQSFSSSRFYTLQAASYLLIHVGSYCHDKRTGTCAAADPNPWKTVGAGRSRRRILFRCSRLPPVSFFSFVAYDGGRETFGAPEDRVAVSTAAVKPGNTTAEAVPVST